MEHVLNWLRAGYPQGVPPKDYYPLLALLSRSLSEEEITKVVMTVLRESGAVEPVTPEQILMGIEKVTEREPNPDEMHQVAARLAAVGWPLAAPL
ncbi:DUF3349 domain-containing protein [Gordonia jinhuaensis]|nr:DUF3349 domain-containing protein [Gordonia jinhuaensis]